MKTMNELWMQHERMWKRAYARARVLAKRADPLTGGADLMVHNWGNEASKAVWARFWARWPKIDKIYARLFTEASNREREAIRKRNLAISA